ncbi:MAG: substrate-binding domain-containing protein [Oscillospiraceae bacterium]|nr:substrate-binding domain-containing protein [Oscillospiraceae bacterium]
MSETRPTLSDVAERSGYALRTVKKVMSGSANVRPYTRDAVLRAAEELHYTRNRAASALARRQQVRLAVIYSQTTDAYFPEVERGFRRCAGDLMDLGLSLEFHIARQRGWQAQRPLLEALLDRDDVHGVVLQPYSVSQVNDCINALAEAGKPVVTFGADAPESHRLCYVGPDAYRLGRIGGQILANYVGKRGKVFIINQGNDHMQTRERCRGFLDRVAEHYPNIQAFEVNLPENSSLYYELVRGIVENEDVAGLFCTDANTVVAGQVLKDLHAQDIALVGFDLSESGVALMNEGYIKVVIEQKPETFSYEAASVLFRHITEHYRPESINNTPMYIMTSECIV